MECVWRHTNVAIEPRLRDTRTEKKEGSSAGNEGRGRAPRGGEACTTTGTRDRRSAQRRQRRAECSSEGKVP